MTTLLQLGVNIQTENIKISINSDFSWAYSSLSRYNLLILKYWRALGRFRTWAPKFHFPISSLFIYLCLQYKICAWIGAWTTFNDFSARLARQLSAQRLNLRLHSHQSLKSPLKAVKLKRFVTVYCTLSFSKFCDDYATSWI